MTREQFERAEMQWRDKNKKLFDENIALRDAINRKEKNTDDSVDEIIALKVRIEEQKHKIKQIEHINSNYYNEICRLKNKVDQLNYSLLKVIDKM